jgi:UDP-GlcNAc:undecaprenyl-phosphate GlcNAc-1-phosphate transferase
MEEGMCSYYLFLYVAGFLSSFIFIRIFKAISLKYNIFSFKGIPCVGGISMGISFFLSCAVILFINKGSHQFIFSILVPALAMLIFGIVDDIKELTVNQKLLAQVFVVFLLIVCGVRTRIVYINDTANILLTFIWIIGITNAFNHIDILDGLAAGTAVIISFAIFIIALMTRDVTVALLSCALTGMFLSFLMFNLPPAKIYMGNSGSHFLGFILALVSLQLSYASLERNVALLSPVFIMGFLIFDTVFLILMRKSKGKSPLLKSNDHLALRFLKLGYSKNKTLCYMLCLAFFFTLCGILLSRISNLAGIVIIGCVIAASVAITILMGRILVDG